MSTKWILLAFGCAALTSGCANTSSEDDTQETVNNLKQAGYPAGDIQIIGKKVFVGNDAEVSLQASREMIETRPGSDGKEQYFTNNLVGGAGTTVICVNGAPFADPTLAAGFNGAIANYNGLFNAGISRLAFQPVSGGPVAGCTFFIDSVVVPGLVGGQSGFPANGAPFGVINIGDGIIQFGPAVAAHVITHEIGHTIGFRHSDFFNRAISCGGAGANEGDGGVGANLVPGTPSDAVEGGSIMNSCFRAVETGQFTGTDVTAMDFLY